MLFWPLPKLLFLLLLLFNHANLGSGTYFSGQFFWPLPKLVSKYGWFHVSIFVKGITFLSFCQHMKYSSTKKISTAIGRIVFLPSPSPHFPLNSCTLPPLSPKILVTRAGGRSERVSLPNTMSLVIVANAGQLPTWRISKRLPVWQYIRTGHAPARHF